MSFFEILTLTASWSEKYVFNIRISTLQSSKNDFLAYTSSNVDPVIYVGNSTSWTFSANICGNLDLVHASILKWLTIVRTPSFSYCCFKPIWHLHLQLHNTVFKKSLQSYPFTKYWWSNWEIIFSFCENPILNETLDRTQQTNDSKKWIEVNGTVSFHVGKGWGPITAN